MVFCFHAVDVTSIHIVHATMLPMLGQSNTSTTIHLLCPFMCLQSLNPRNPHRGTQIHLIVFPRQGKPPRKQTRAFQTPGSNNRREPRLMSTSCWTHLCLAAKLIQWFLEYMLSRSNNHVYHVFDGLTFQHPCNPLFTVPFMSPPVSNARNLPQWARKSY